MGQITLTEGKPKVVAVSTIAGGDETEMLRLAVSLEKGSEHPLAGAIVNGTAEKRALTGRLYGRKWKGEPVDIKRTRTCKREVGNLFALLRIAGNRKVLLKEGGNSALNCRISVQGMLDFYYPSTAIKQL